MQISAIKTLNGGKCGFDQKNLVKALEFLLSGICSNPVANIPLHIIETHPCLFTLPLLGRLYIMIYKYNVHVIKAAANTASLVFYAIAASLK